MAHIITKFFEYDQNNITGTSCLVIDEVKGIGKKVWIEATSPAHANARAEEIGLNFDDRNTSGYRWRRELGNGLDNVEIFKDSYYPNRSDEGFIHTIDGNIHKVDCREALPDLPFIKLIEY